MSCKLKQTSSGVSKTAEAGGKQKVAETQLGLRLVPDTGSLVFYRSRQTGSQHTDPLSVDSLDRICGLARSQTCSAEYGNEYLDDSEGSRIECLDVFIHRMPIERVWVSMTFSSGSHLPTRQPLGGTYGRSVNYARLEGQVDDNFCLAGNSKVTAQSRSSSSHY